MQIKLIKELPSLLKDQQDESATEVQPVVVGYQRDKPAEDNTPSEQTTDIGDSEFVSDEYNHEDFEDGQQLLIN